MFDAWGSLIKVQDKNGNTLAGLTFLDRGYTGHEHLQSVGLINMNARLYDPMLHRFLQVDNYIQDPTNTQNYNQYGYVLNNPLLYTDPSGNAFNDGKDCVNCGPTDGQQTAIGSAISTIVTNWDEWGIKDWAKKNINIKNWGKSIGKWFGGGSRSSEPPPNMSSYVNLNTTSFMQGQFKNNMITNNIKNPQHNSNMSPKEIEMISKLHQGFDAIEEVGGWMEIGSVLLAPVTEGGSLALGPVGLWHSAVGTAGNMTVDYYEGNYKMMIYRGVKFTVTFGIGKAIDRIPGSEYIIDKTILKTTTFIYDKLVSPSIQRNFVPVKNLKI